MRSFVTGCFVFLTMCCCPVASGAELTLRLAEDDPNMNSGVVGDAACSPNGTLLAAAYGRFIGLLQEPRPGQAILWDLRTGKRRATLLGHDDGVSCVAFSPDGRLLATGGFDANVILWDPATGKRLAALGTRRGPVLSFAFSPDGQTLAVGRMGGDDPQLNVAQLWGVADRKLTGTLTGHAAGIWAVSYSPDGATLATGSMDGTARLWDLKTQREKKILVNDRGATVTVRFSAKGGILATASSAPDTAAIDARGRIRLWAIDTWKERASFESPSGVLVYPAFSPDGKHLAGAGDAVEIRNVMQTAKATTVAAKCPATFSPDGNSLIVRHDENVLVVLPFVVTE